MSQMDTDPIVKRLDLAAQAPGVSAEIARVLALVTKRLQSGQDTMAWETVPLSAFEDLLPPAIESCWVFVIRAGSETGAERHPNSHQRSLSLIGAGEFQLRLAEEWDPHPLVSDPREALERRWISIPPNTWHRLFAGPVAWGMLSFHTVKSGELIEERPVGPGGIHGGLTERHLYSDQE